MEQGQQVSDNFTCHSWSKVGLLLICTDMGEMIVLKNDGEYKALVSDAPKSGPIESVVSLQNGFLIAHQNRFYFYKNTSVDDRLPLKRHNDQKMTIINEPQHMATSNVIQCMAIN